MSNPHDLMIGQKLWLVPAGRHGGVPREVTVGKIGREWGELEECKFWRFNLTTLVVADKRGEYSHR